MDMKLEGVVIPVADVDRAKHFKGLRWRPDADSVADAHFRVAQLTPPGPACSFIFGAGVTPTVPGSAQVLHPVVADVEAALDELNPDIRHKQGPHSPQAGAASDMGEDTQ